MNTVHVRILLGQRPDFAVDKVLRTRVNLAAALLPAWDTRYAGWQLEELVHVVKRPS
jgi:hypothetical protein